MSESHNPSTGKRSRRAADLSAEQVSRKRAMDRANQRSYRAKNKAYIRCLEDKIAELTYRLGRAEDQLAQQPPCQCQKRKQQQAGPGRSRAAQSPRISQTASTTTDTPNEASETYSPSAMSPFNIRSITSNGQESPEFDANTFMDSLALDFGTGVAANLFGSAQGFDLLDLSKSPDASSIVNRFSEQVIARALENDRTASIASTSPESAQDTPPWKELPLHLPPTSSLDEVIVSCSHAWRNRFVRAGNRDTELSEPMFPSISPLLNRSSEADGVARPLSVKLAAQVENSPMRHLVERIGFMYKLSLYLRWLVCRTRETYERMPEYLRPTRLQLTVPHPAWIDVVTYPAARDAIINKEMEWGQFELFSDLTGESTSANWPYPDSGAFMESADGHLLKLSPMFEAHIRKLESWTFGTKVGEVFPFMKPFCKP